MLQGGRYGTGPFYSYEDAIQLYRENGWTTVAHMKEPRAGHAASVVNIDDVICSTSSSVFGCNAILIFLHNLDYAHKKHIITII